MIKYRDINTNGVEIVVEHFPAYPVFTMVNDGDAEAFQAGWNQFDAWAEWHSLDFNWAISDGSPVQEAIDADHTEAITLDPYRGN